jgi:hypothetical protein
MAIAEPSTGDAPEIEDGMYNLTCTDVSDPFEEMDFNGQKKIKKVRIFIQVHGTDDGEGGEVTLDPKVNLKWSSGGDYPPSTLYLYATALCGPQDGDIPFDTDNLKGKSCQGMIKTEAGKWPRIEPKSLLPLKKGKGIDFSKLPIASNAAKVESDDVPFETDASPLNAWLDAMKGVGFSTKEIIDLCKSRFEKMPKDLSDLERGLLSTEYGA